MCSGVAGLVNGLADRGVVERGADHLDELRVEIHVHQFDATHRAHLSGNRGAGLMLELFRRREAPARGGGG
jgi:hypothetical protein